MFQTILRLFALIFIVEACSSVSTGGFRASEVIRPNGIVKESNIVKDPDRSEIGIINSQYHTESTTVI